MLSHTEDSGTTRIGHMYASSVTVFAAAIFSIRD